MNSVRAGRAPHHWMRQVPAQPQCRLSVDRQSAADDLNGGAKLPGSLWPAYRNVRSDSGNYCRSTALLTDAQSQGTKVASTVARGGKTEGISGLFR